MSFSFGFYNAVDHDRRYDAVQMSEIFDGIINDGVYATYGDHFIVKASTNNNEVIVGSGRAWFDHTWNKNDADIPITAPDSELLLKRIDALVIDVNSNIESRTNSLTWVQGEPSVNNPIKPTLIDEPSHHQHPLAYITRNANAVKINEADIENVVGTDECPFVTGIIETISTSALVAQWAAQWQDWMTGQQTDFLSWSTEQKNSFASWMAGEKVEFDDWFANLHYVLDGDVAGHLQNEIDDIKATASGSIFRISTTNQSLYGKIVRLYDSNDIELGSATFDSNGYAEIKGITKIGALKFVATDGSQTGTTNLVIEYFGNYPVDLSFWAATINITTNSSELYGQTITIEKDGVILGNTPFSMEGTATYIATAPGLYTFSVTY